MSIQKSTGREERREGSFSSQSLIAKLPQTSFLASTSVLTRHNLPYNVTVYKKGKGDNFAEWKS